MPGLPLSRNQTMKKQPVTFGDDLEDSVSLNSSKNSQRDKENPDSSNITFQTEKHSEQRKFSFGKKEIDKLGSLTLTKAKSHSGQPRQKRLKFAKASEFRIQINQSPMESEIAMSVSRNEEGIRKLEDNSKLMALNAEKINELSSQIWAIKYQ